MLCAGETDGSDQDIRRRLEERMLQEDSVTDYFDVWKCKYVLSNAVDKAAKWAKIG